MKKIIILLFLSIFILNACSSSISELKEENKLIDKERQIKPVANDFSFDIFKELVSSNENLFISPYSLSTALTMAYIGADGDTKKEMKNVLKLGNIDIDELKKDVLHLKYHLENVSDKAEFSVANALFLKKEIPFLDSYIENGKNYWEAEIDYLPSTGKPINDWVKKQTKDKIQEIIDSGPIDPLVIAYLVNAIYFKADWQSEFKENLTKIRPFYSHDKITDVEMMENKTDYHYLIDEDLEAIKLEYGDGEFLFYAIMPDNLEDFYANFNQESFNELKDSLYKGELTLRLPKFKLEEKYKISDVLNKMGMPLAFHPSLANFSNMVDLEALNENVYISEVYHSTFIEVDEKGTEAAAATAVEMKMESLALDPLIIEFNRPFIFLIEEKETNTLLFMGQLQNIK
jgi:serine protease inhibitor